jgi:DNA replication protein DnaC
MNAILSGWKNSGTFTIDSASKQNSISPESYNKEFERRREIAISKAQKNLESAMELDGFKAVYSRLNSIEKDLAFAEISEDNEKLNILENEKKSLLEKQRKLLKGIGLTEKDLSPDYKCKKCNDTGYVGTKKCDCF